MAADCRERNAEGGEIGWVQRAFGTAFCDGDDAAEGGGALEEREKVGGEAVAGVVAQGGQEVEVLRCFCG